MNAHFKQRARRAFRQIYGRVTGMATGRVTATLLFH
jgi:hypothetical protein